MAEGLTLIGFGPSVYTRIVRMGLIETGLKAAYVECDPFAETPDPVLSNLTPFGRVPVLRDGDFTLTETAAILRYLVALSGKPSLIPTEPRAAARMVQVMGIVDAYCYLPMVRDVFSHGYFRSMLGAEVDPSRVAAGLEASQAPLSALNKIAAEGLQLKGQRISLADIHLAPMIAFFTMVPDAEGCLETYPALRRWWAAMSSRPSLLATNPFAPS